MVETQRKSERKAVKDIYKMKWEEKETQNIAGASAGENNP